MTIPVITFFNNKGGVGKTSLVYHLSWMYSDLGLRVVAADLDPQANLTSAFLDEDRLEEIWSGEMQNFTVFGCIKPLLDGVGDINTPKLEKIDENLDLLVGDLLLSGLEDELAGNWPLCLDRKPRAFRVISALWRIMQNSAEQIGADIILADLGPNLGAINRAALISADYVVVPLSPDLFSLQGLRNLGPTLRRWRSEWQERLPKNPILDLQMPSGSMKPLGYVVLQHSVRLDRPVKAYQKWIKRIPPTYRKHVLAENIDEDINIEIDPNQLALLKHYRSLMPMAQEIRKPMFHLQVADGAIGAHYGAVKEIYSDFKDLAQEISKRAGLSLPV